MFTLLVILLVLDALLLSAVVLLQAGQGGGLASLGGGASDAYLGGRQAVTILTKATWWTGGAFLALALILSVMSASRSGVGGRSTLQERLRQNAAPAQQDAPAPLPLQTAPPAGQQAPAAETPAPPQPQTDR